MTFSEFPLEIRSALAIWQMFRGWGFDSDALFVGIVEGRLHVQVSDDQHRFSVSLGKTLLKPSSFAKLWEKLAACLPSCAEETLEANFHQFVTPERWLQTLDALDSHGIRLPNDPRTWGLN